MEVLSLSRRRARRENKDGHWGPKWRRLLVTRGNDSAVTIGATGTDSEPPQDYTEFDRTVRGMLNRISTENARRLLPLELGLNGSGDDCPPWWAARFAALMLSSYLHVIHTSRCARGLAMRSADNVLPQYLDAVGPLLAQSPRLVEALLAWIARLLQSHSLCWPTTRLLLLAAKEGRGRAYLPEHSIGRLPPELLRGRILEYLAPPALPVGAAAAACSLEGGWSMEDGQKDVIAVLAHLIMFAPPKSWPRVSAFAFFLAETALTGHDELAEGRVYLAASILVTVAQRLDRKVSEVPTDEAHVATCEGKDAQRMALLQDLAPLSRLTTCLFDAAGGGGEKSVELSGFVNSRAKAALEHVRRVQDRLLPVEPSKGPTGSDRFSCRGQQR